MKFGKYQPEATKNRFRTKAQEFNKQLVKDIKAKGHIEHHIYKHYPQKKKNPGEVENELAESSEDSEDQILNTKRN